MVYGEFKTLDIGVLTFQAEVLGEVKVKHYEVATLSATKHFYRTRLLFSDENFGWLLPSDTGSVLLYDILDTVEVELSRLAYISRLQEDFVQRWNGLLNMGMSYTRSSDILRYNVDGHVNYDGQDIDLDLRGTAIFTGESGAVVREREELYFQLDRFLNANWSTFVSAQYQRNQTLGLLYRYQPGLGINYRGYLSNHIGFRIGVGAVYNTEQSLEGLGNESVEAPIKLRFRFLNYRDPNISVILSQNIYFGISEVGRIRHDGEIRFQYEIVHNLSLSLVFYDNFDTQSPATGGSLLDYGLVSGVSYNF